MASGNAPQLILWRHAEAEELTPVAGGRRVVARRAQDMERVLTRRGRAQARRMAAWLRARLPAGVRVLSSPARRCADTAQALTESFEELPELGPTRDAADLLSAIGWPDLSGTVIVVGHQPTLGRVASLLIAGRESDWSVKKAAVWWIARRVREDDAQHVLRAVVGPDLALD